MSKVKVQININENLLEEVNKHIKEINKNKRLKRSIFIEKFIKKYLK